MLSKRYENLCINIEYEYVLCISIILNCKKKKIKFLISFISFFLNLFYALSTSLLKRIQFISKSYLNELSNSFTVCCITSKLTTRKSLLVNSLCKTKHRRLKLSYKIKYFSQRRILNSLVEIILFDFSKKVVTGLRNE